MQSDRHQQAWALLQEAYRVQMEGDYDHAVKLYKNSLDLFPTADGLMIDSFTFGNSCQTAFAHL